MKHYRGYRRCSRIDYGDPGNTFVVTICVSPRRAIFSDEAINSVLLEEIQQLNNEGAWTAHVFCLMPDHLHLMITPGPEGLSAAVKLFKGRTASKTRNLREAGRLWQRSYFDHRIRSSESFSDKCAYILLNPVRAGLCDVPEDFKWCGVLAMR